VPEAVEFGCDFCRDDQNRLFGHVAHIGSSPERETNLLRCPRCFALYENTPAGPDTTRRLTDAEATRLFPVAYSATLRPGEVEEASVEGLDSESPDAWMRTHGRVGDPFTYCALVSGGSEIVRGEGRIDPNGDPAYRLSA
jgi:hypothetical protein